MQTRPSRFFLGGIYHLDSPEPSFETDDTSYVLVTLPAHVNDQASDGAVDQANLNVFMDLDDVVAYCDGASDQVKAILEAELNDKVMGLLEGAINWVSREEH